MGFLVTTLIFVVIGIIASLCTRICCNRGPSANLFHLTFGYHSYSLLLVDVGNCISCSNETTHTPDPERSGVNLCSEREQYRLCDRSTSTSTSTIADWQRRQIL